MIIVIDDENRENEGDLFISAELATYDIINFMVTFGRGLICTPITKKRSEELNLPYMTEKNSDFYKTAFTISIDSKKITTGISVNDRLNTILDLSDENKNSKDFKRPGHIFPLIAKEGGTLKRAGHTEAAVDLAKLAGFKPSGVICEILNDDGSMARRDDLVAFSEKHKLKTITIKDLIEYRKKM